MKVSIISPVYNAADTIGRFLTSLASQTHKDIEIVLVDDHGDDDSMECARQFVRTEGLEPRVVYVDGGYNRGPGEARNLGITHATGDYIAFVDSDDWIEPDFLQRLVATATENDADLAFGSIVFNLPNGFYYVRHNPTTTEGAFVGRAKRQFLMHYASFFTTFLYRREMLLKYHILFPPTRSAEDSCFLGCSLLAAQRVARDDNAIYHYVVSSISVSQRRDRKRASQRLVSWKVFRAFARANGFYASYRFPILWLSFKKGFLMAFRDILRG
jgi:glycosyltransferase involved in cell wall biosynthesis